MKYSLLLLLLFPLLSMAQPAGDLTIFSEDGDKFFLILNGQRQNDVAQTNVRIEDLPQPYYSAKIIFEDKGLGEISKNIPIADPSTNAMMDVTYKIKKDNKGSMKLRYFSAIPPAPNYVAPADVYVMHYGTPPPPPAGSTTVTQQTTTTTVGNTVGANVNVNGMNVGVSVSDPYASGTVTQTTTTTTTTTSGYSEGSYAEEHHHEGRRREGDCYPMNNNDFAQAKKTIADASFAETMLSTAKGIIAHNCLTADQVVQICNLFSFEESKLDFAKCAYPKTVDPNNYFKVVNAFTYSSSKEELNNYISSH